MANKFEISVVALDRYSKVFRDLNTKASKAIRPLTTAQRQLGALSREMHLDKVARGITKLTSVSLGFGRAIGAVTPQLESAFGLGMLGRVTGIGGAVAAFGASLAALGARAGRAGFEIGQTSKTLGVSTRDLQTYRGAAEQAGVSSDTLTDAFHSLGNTLQGALNGRNGDAAGVLDKLGIRIKRNKDGVVDTAAAYDDLADAIKRAGDPQVQELIARHFGIEGTLPLLRQGADAIRQYRKEQEAFGVATEEQIRSADTFTASLNRLKRSMSALTDQAGYAVLPWLTPATNAATRATDAAKGVLMGSMKKGSTDLFRGGTPLGIAADLNLRFLSRLLGDSSTTPEQRRASGIVTPLMPSVKWNNPGNLRSWSGVPSVGGFASFDSPIAGLNAMAEQINRYATRDKLTTINGIVSKYAPPSENNTGAYISDVARQTGYGPDQQLNLNDAKTLAPLLSAMVRHEQGKQPFTPEQYAQAAQQVTVRVAFDNAPPGTKVEARSSNGGFVPTRVAYSMPTRETP